MCTTVKVKHVESGKCVAILVAIHDDPDLVEEDLRIDFWRLLRHVFVDNHLDWTPISAFRWSIAYPTHSGLPSDGFEDVLMIRRADQLKKISSTPLESGHGIPSV